MNRLTPEEYAEFEEFGLTIGDNLKFFREEKGLKSLFVAEKLGMSKAQYSNLERGMYKPSIESLLRLCRFFKKSPNQILGWK